MSHVFIEESKGTSKDSLSNAIANAIRGGVKGHNFGGDHIVSITIVIDGYEKIGDEFQVKLKVIIFDHELARQDYYKETEKSQQERYEKEELMNHYYAANLHAHHTGHHSKEIIASLKDSLEDYADIAHLEHIEVIGTYDVQKQIEAENTPPALNKNYIAISALTLGPGSDNSDSSTTKPFK